MKTKSVLALAISLALSCATTSAETLNKTITGNKTLSEDLTVNVTDAFAIDNATLNVGKNTAWLTTTNPNAKNEAGKKATIGNATITGNGGTVIVTSDGYGVDDAHSLNVSGLDTFTITAGNKGFTGNWADRSISAKNISITAVDDAVQRQGSSSNDGYHDTIITGFDNLTLKSTGGPSPDDDGGYAIQNSSDPAYGVIRITGNTGSKIQLIGSKDHSAVTSYQPASSLISCILLGKCISPKTEISGGTIYMEATPSASYQGVLWVNDGTVSLHSDLLTVIDKGLNDSANAIAILGGELQITSQTDRITPVLQVTGNIKGSGKGKGQLHFEGSDSFLTGEIKNEAQDVKISLTNGSTWTTDGDSNSTNLTVADSSIHFVGNSWQKIEVADLQGSGGTIHLKADLVADKADHVIAEKATGAYKLYVAASSSGSEPVATMKDFIVKTGNSGGSFSLGDKVTVDAGTYLYEYSLQSRAATEGTGTEWYLERGPAKTTTPSTDAGLLYAGLNYQSSQWLADLDTLRDRAGEIRYSRDKAGSGWVRVLGSKERFTGLGGTLKAETYGLQIGADARLPDSRWTLGASFKAADANLSSTLSSGHSKSDSDTYAGHLYATYLADNDAYVDIVLGYAHNNQDLSFSMLDGTGVKGSFSSNGYGASIETGRQFTVARNEHRMWFVEPQAQLSYFRVTGADYSLSNGMDIHRDNAQSLIGRLGLVAGQTFLQEQNRFWQWDIKAGLRHEFAGNENIYVNGNRFDGDLGDTRAYLGLGLNWQPKSSLRSYVNLLTEHGRHYHRDIAVNAGVRYLW